MSELRPRGVPVMLEGKEHHFLFTLNAIDALQDKLGKSMHEAMEDLTEEKSMMHTLRDMLVILSEDEAEREQYRNPDSDVQPITEREAGLLIGMDNAGYLIGAVMAAYGYSLPDPDEDDDPNRESGQRNS